MENTAEGAPSQREAVAHGDEAPPPPTLAAQRTASTAESTVRTETTDNSTYTQSWCQCECCARRHDRGGAASTARSTASSASAPRVRLAGATAVGVPFAQRAEWTYNTLGMDERGCTVVPGVWQHTGRTPMVKADCGEKPSRDSSSGTRTNSFDEHWHNVEGGRRGGGEWAAAHNTLGMDEHGCTVGTADRRTLERLARKFAPGGDTATQSSETFITEITCDDDEETPSTRASASVADCAADAAHAVAHCAHCAGAELRSVRRAVVRISEQLDELSDAVDAFFRVITAAIAADTDTGGHSQQCSRMH